MASDELSGFAQGFASTFVPTYTKRLADEQNAAIRAADKYSKQEAAIAKAEKEDQDRITAAKDLVRGLKLEGNQFNEAWKWAYGQLKMGINPRNIQTDIREGTLTFPGIEQTTVTLPNESTDVNKQTDEVLDNADAAITEVEEKEDLNLFQRMKKGYNETVTDPLEKLGYTADRIEEINKGFTSDVGTSSAVFTPKPDKEDIPKTLIGALTQKLLTSEKYINASPEEQTQMLNDAIQAQKGSDSPPGSPSALLTRELYNSEKYQSASTEDKMRMGLELAEEIKKKDSDTDSLVTLMRDLENLDKSDPNYAQKAAEIEARYNRELTLRITLSRLEDEGLETKTFINTVTPGRTIEVYEVPNIQGNLEARNARNNELITNTNDFVELTPDLAKDAKERRTGLKVARDKYRTDVVKLKDGFGLAGQIMDIVETNPTALTFAGGTLPKFLKDAGIEIVAIGQTLQNFAERAKGKDPNALAVSQAEFEAELRVSGALQEGQTLDDVVGIIENAIGQGNVDAGTARALLDAKVTLMAFRMGGLEGQSGNALSNKDFERLIGILRSSKDPRVVQQLMADYMSEFALKIDANARTINGDPSIKSFITANGFSPFYGEDAVISFNELAQQYVDENDEGMITAIEYINKYKTIKGNVGLPVLEEKVEEEEGARTSLNQDDLSGSYEALPELTKYSYIDKDGVTIFGTKPKKTQE